LKASSRLRLVKVLLLFAILFGIAEARLAWVQLGIGGKKQAHAVLQRQAALQHADELVLDNGRGHFLDRNGVMLTGKTVRALAAFPAQGMPRGTEEELGELSDILGADRDRLAEWLDELRTADVWRAEGGKQAYSLSEEQAARIRSLDLSGIAVLPYRNRYPDEAAFDPLQAIGYVSQDPSHLRETYGKRLADLRINETDPIGGAGLEHSLDRLLRGTGPTKAMQLTDGARRPLKGLGIHVASPDNAHYPLQVKTTIDAGMQRAVTEVLDKHGIRRGAVVVLDAGNADVLAMVSLPAFDPGRIGAAGTDERNHALLAVAPGSIFKTVTLAAALEAGITDVTERFYCDGTYGRYGLKCWHEGGHGLLTLEEAFAESCNVVFAALAERLDPALLQSTADKLGIGRQVGWSAERFVDGQPLRLLPEEQAGAVFADLEAAKDGGVRTGSGIGQRDVRVTPLQAANLAVTLLHGGKVLAPRIVSEIRYADGGRMARLHPQTASSAHGKIGQDTAAFVRKAMESVVAKGTAASALKTSVWPLAGKSGTAELAGRDAGSNHHWFIGYGPAKGKARFAVSVLLEKEPAGLRNRAGAVFGDIMEALRLLEEGRTRKDQPATAVPSAGAEAGKR